MHRILCSHTQHSSMNRQALSRISYTYPSPSLNVKKIQDWSHEKILNHLEFALKCQEVGNSSSPAPTPPTQKWFFLLVKFSGNLFSFFGQCCHIPDNMQDDIEQDDLSVLVFTTGPKTVLIHAYRIWANESMSTQRHSQVLRKLHVFLHLHYQRVTKQLDAQEGHGRAP